MQKKMWLDYPSSINDIVERNKSFDACTIRVMYTGKNRNRTSISKEAVEKAIPTLYNCPIVCNYDVEEDKIGGHDVEFVKTKNGLKMVNLTDAVGVIPEGAEYRWETVEDNGTEHEYLVVDGILWKRSSAYEKLKKDGISGQSMEITVNSGKSVDGVFEIYSFDFTAFCILGEDVEPCFESADIETFSLEVYKTRFEHMMEDLKMEYSMAANTTDESGKEFSSKGGEGKVNLTELMAKYNLVEADITFDTDGMSVEELEAKFAEIQSKKATFAGEEGEPEGGAAEAGAAEGGAGGEGASLEGDGPTGELGDGLTIEEEEEGEDPAQPGEGTTEPEADPNSDEEDDASGTPGQKKSGNFALMAGQLADELYRALSAETFHDDFWDEDCRRYWYIDHDAEAQRVYAQDWRDDVICAFNYSMNGDTVVVDFASYKRQKVQFVDFDEGETTMAMFGKAHDAMQEVFSKKLEKATADMAELKKFHDETVAAQRKAQLDEVFASFADMNGNESFEELKGNCDALSVEEITEKCYAIRGRSVKVNFSVNQPTSVRLPVERKLPEKNDPYNGVFARYGF